MRARSDGNFALPTVLKRARDLEDVAPLQSVSLARVPVISYFFGIYVRMYHDDHPPPHFHAEYQGHEAFVSIENGELMDGHLPTRALRIVRDWCLEHRGELMDNWTRAQALLPLERIPGADND